MSEVVSRPVSAPAHHHDHGAMVRPHHRSLPMKVGTRASPLALYQTRHFLSLITQFCPLMRGQKAFEEHQIITSGDAIQSRRLAEIGGKGLFAKEIHEALLDGRVDFAVHSLKDLETELPPGIALACVLEREDARDAIILGAGMEDAVDPGNPLASLPHGALIGTSSVDLDWDCAPDNGETLGIFVQRTRDALAHALADTAPVLVIAHGGTLHVLAALLSISVTPSLLANAQPLRFERQTQGWSAIALGAARLAPVSANLA